MATIPRWRRHLSRRITTDLTAAASFLALAVYIGHRLLAAPNGRLLARNWQDQVLIEWFLGYGSRVWLGDFDLVTERLNSPDGVNLMSNASHIAHAVLLAPVTWLWGAPTSFAVALVGNLAATAMCWYLLFSRELVVSRIAAWTGGLFAGFAPGMISQSQSHLHISAGWLVPLLVWCVIKLWRDERPVRWGALLGVLAAVQLFLGEEVLFFAVAATFLFALVWAAQNFRAFKERAIGLGLGLCTAAFVALAIVLYPLAVQFTGRQHLNNAPFAAEYFSADLLSWIAYSPLTVGGGATDVKPIAPNHTELNTFLGPVLILVSVAAIVFLWRRRPVVRPLALVIAVMFALSLGPEILIGGAHTGIPGPYTLIADMPVIDAALPTRYALIILPPIGALLALLIDAAKPRGLLTSLRLQLAGMPGDKLLVARWTVLVVVVIALAPLLPRSLPTAPRSDIPEFITSGQWRDCVPPGGVLVPVPPPTPGNPNTMRWPTYANGAFGVPEGFFLGPYGKDGTTSMGTWSRGTARIWREVWETAAIPEITEEQIAATREDLAAWKADCVVIPDYGRQAELVQVTTALLGPGEAIGDVWIWRVPRD
ncbi:hypothetical protein AB0I28_16970 [Phytomonospora sp. NPDC050363]|uniref:hypothetical protein n=1 Tax=Phytomonospora sp. NPDC050363 TaxID=3155642 RepID=UPI0033F4DBDD